MRALTSVADWNNTPVPCAERVPASGRQRRASSFAASMRLACARQAPAHAAQAGPARSLARRRPALLPGASEAYAARSSTLTYTCRTGASPRLSHRVLRPLYSRGLRKARDAFALLRLCARGGAPRDNAAQGRGALACVCFCASRVWRHATPTRPAAADELRGWRAGACKARGRVNSNGAAHRRAVATAQRPFLPRMRGEAQKRTW